MSLKAVSFHRKETPWEEKRYKSKTGRLEDIKTSKTS